MHGWLRMIATEHPLVPCHLDSSLQEWQCICLFNFEFYSVLNVSVDHVAISEIAQKPLNFMTS